MIRWKFVLTRVLVVAAVVTLLRWGMGPTVRFVTVRSMQLATGARVDIARADVGLFPPRVDYVDLRVADPRGRKAYRDLFRADSISLEIDGDAFLHRRWVIRHGRITGLEIGSRRATSGHFEEEPEADDPDSGPSLLSRIAGGAVDALGEQASELVDDLETVRRSREIRERWESEYRELEARAERLEGQVRQIRAEAKSVKNPLRDYPALDRAIAQANDLRAELLEVRRRIDGLPGQMHRDLASLEEAKRIDLEKVDRYLPDRGEDAGDFASELVAKAVRQRLRQLQEYLDHGRQIADLTVRSPKQERGRGETIDLVGAERPPSFLMRQCEVSGLLRSRGQIYTMTGVVENVTPTPERLLEPTHARLSLEDTSLTSEPLRLDYVRDRRGGNDVDRVTLLWPRSPARPAEWGSDEEIGIAVEGGERELWAQVIRDGDQIRGRLVSKQTGLRMRLRVAPRFATSPIAMSIDDRLSDVDRIEIDARFGGTWQVGGTWEAIDLRLESNLERVLREAADEAIAAQIEASRAKLAATIRRRHARHTEDLQEWIGTRQSEARHRLAAADRSIEEVFQSVTRGIGSAETYLGRLRDKLPTGLR